MRKPSLFILACAAILGGGFYYGRQLGLPGATQSETQLHVDQASLKLGRVLLSDGYKHTVAIENRSMQHVHVRDIQSSCTCTSIEPRNFSIPPYERAIVSVTLDLTTADPDPESSTRYERPVSVSLLPLLDDGPRSQWVLGGVVVSPFVLTPNVAGLDDTSCIRGSPYRSCKLYVHYNESPEHNSIAVYDTSIVRTSWSSDRRRLTVTPRSDLPTGEYKTAISVKSQLSNGRFYTAPSAEMTFRVVDDVECVPESLALGVLPTYKELARSVYLRSRTEQPFTIVGVHALSKEIAVTCQSDDEVQVTLIPRQMRQFRSSVEVAITQSHAGAFPYRVTLPITYYGVASSDSLGASERGNALHDWK